MNKKFLLTGLFVIVVIVMLCAFTMISDEESKPVPIYSVLMDEVPVRIQNMLLSHNPELMDMKYLLKHKDEYLSITPDDFIAIKGKVRKTKQHNEDDTTEIEYYIDDVKFPLIQIYDKDEDIKDVIEDQNYYFFVTVIKTNQQYTYNVIDFCKVKQKTPW